MPNDWCEHKHEHDCLYSRSRLVVLCGPRTPSPSPFVCVCVLCVAMRYALCVVRNTSAYTKTQRWKVNEKGRKFYVPLLWCTGDAIYSAEGAGSRKTALRSEGWRASDGQPNAIGRNALYLCVSARSRCCCDSRKWAQCGPQLTN